MTTTPKRKPTHPGIFFRTIVFPALGLSVSDLAKVMRVTRQTMHAVMSGRSKVTPDMALRLGKLCGNGPNIWMNMQGALDLWVEEVAISSELDAIPTLKEVEKGNDRQNTTP